ncbi:SDR family NAD(P)-dependent oxidoreductase [Cohnella sp. JJ-181]|uniref:SDR family NAD(P)-dependent oxidoreductase n=1 Tax=Cohnella rhizoplanae TaxID=2974897 RepID=UPI0022FF5551|nr:SDR family NAD(P)-dependent oxidoreductase [Cohnella sp. JJ-181]CAI6077723.1 Dihydroanticapsin 7-dehydrogenase [Cohnella sp. JJ-181]
MKEAIMSFENKVAIVTGGAMGIGADIARRLLMGKAKVAIADVSERGEAVAAGWREKGFDAMFVSCDVTSAADVSRLVSQTEQRYGTIDILVNNAGIFPRATLLDMDEALWHRVLDVNLKGTMLTCKAVLPVMVRGGGGSIVNIGSLHHAKGAEDTLAYAVAKSGIVTFTRNVAASSAKHRIRANVVHPGWVMSEGETARIEQAGTLAEAKRMSSRLPLGRHQTGEDIANAVAFFCSELASQVTGQELAVDGGMSVV